MKSKRLESHRLRLHREQTPNGIFSVTKCVQPKRPVLDEEIREFVVSSFRFCVERGDIELSAFVVMPDHFHLLVGLLKDLTLSFWMKCLMSFVSAKMTSQLRVFGCHWQEGFYGTEVHSEKQFNYLTDYTHDNPVRAGLIASPEEWNASSASSLSWVRLTW
jgi:REP element-mobilizing transposase RayT